MSTCFEPCARPRWQRGDMLIEALVGVLLLCILGAGMVYVATQLTGAQRDARIEGMAVIGMRQLLREHGEGLCDGASSRPMAVGGDDLALEVNVDVACQAGTTVQVQASGVGSMAVDMPRQITLSLAPEALGLPADGVSLVVGTHQ
ncbi:hypothetical protein WCE41_11480 [Luteimonas sp. MJ246]|uniref:hypothetical protein n=1 Tax=Luteimonas sp. MJ174 TaxID=3129237 RepID=UPI0031B9F73C